MATNRFTRAKADETGELTVITMLFGQHPRTIHSDFTELFSGNFVFPL